jgi:transcriptional antiterminator NusG
VSRIEARPQRVLHARRRGKPRRLNERIGDILPTEGGEALLMAAGTGTRDARGTAVTPECLPLTGTAAWYAIWTHSHCEQPVAHQLAAKAFEVFLPEMSVRSRRAGKSRLIHVPMFPGYLFVRTAIDKHRYVEMVKIRGIVRVLADGWNRLAPIQDAEIDAIQRVMAAHVPVLPHAHLSAGDRVKVVEGPLAGVEGLFVQDRPHKGRLVLSIDLLGRSVAVEVDSDAVVPSCNRNLA